MKLFFRGFLVVILVAFLAGSVYAEPTVKDLQSQLDKLMKQVDDQKKQIETLQHKIGDIQTKQAPQAATAAAPAEAKVNSKYKINIYGKLKFDAIYDTNNMGKDEFITYLPKTADGKDKTTFNVRDTRLGIAIEGPSYNGWSTKGRFETDFYGNAADSSSNGALRIRLAYLDFAKGDTSIRVGQDWTPIASLNPTTLDFAIAGYNGNLWNRVPQITVQQKFGGGLEGLLSIYRYRWSDDNDTFGSTAITTQIQMPWVGAKVGYSGLLLDPERKAWLALGGAVRKGEVKDNDVTPYLLALELQIPFNMFELKGEAYMGQGLGGEYFHKGGSFNTEGHAIMTSGGWAQLNVRPMKDLDLNVGYGIDDPKDSDVAGSYYRQSSYTYGNVIYQIMKDISAGVEGTYVNTEWDTKNQHGWRYTTSLMYNW
jgi:hypothetical protein